MKKRIFFLLGCFYLAVGGIYSQVGINTENPYKLTELHIQNIVNGNDTIPKGIMIPRLTEAQRDAMDMSEVDNVNSLMIYNISEDCYNYYSKNAEEWQSLCGRPGKAVIDNVYCDEIKYYGNYIKGVQTTPQEYMVIPVDVSKIGQYTITVNALYDASTSNGYSFTGNGDFLYTGKQYVTLTAQGIPQQEHYDPADANVGDHIEMLFNGTKDPDLQCADIRIPVTPALAEYNVRCNSAKVYGIYTVLPDKTNSDDDTHYIELEVDVTDISANAASGWSATTDSKNGLTFRGSGKFTTEGERQKIRLYAVSGSKANTYNPIEMTITFQTRGGTTSCRVTVRPAFTRKKIIGFSNNWGYSYAGQGGASGEFLKSNKNFGNADNSTVKMVATNTPISGAATYNGSSYVDFNAFQYRHMGGGTISKAQFQGAMNEKPDIIIIGYSATWSDDAADIAIDYLNQGGIIIEFSESSNVTRILNRIFGTSTIKRNSSSYVLATLPSIVDPLIEGPFQVADRKSIGGLNIAGDTENRLYSIANIPSSGIISYGYGAGDRSSEPVCFRTLGHRYFYFGDGGFLCNDNNGSWLSAITEPFATTGTDHQPAMRPNTANFTDVVNSFFFGNVMAWAIEESQFYGVNAK